jgi:hypothetical protein
MLFGDTHLLDRFVNGQSWNDAGPPETAAALFPDVGKPLVPAPAKRRFNLGPLGNLLDPQCVMEDLGLNPEFIHMPQSKVHVGHFAGRLRRFDFST